MFSEQMDQSYYLALLGFVVSAKQHLITISSEFGLSGIQAATLLLLDKQKPQPMKSFCQLYHCDASNITGIIDGLEKRGLVSRQADAHDRRIKVVQLEPAGEKLRYAIIKRLDADKSYLFDPLTESEAEQFIKILRKLALATMSPTCGDI